MRSPGADGPSLFYDEGDIWNLTTGEWKPLSERYSPAVAVSPDAALI